MEADHDQQQAEKNAIQQIAELAALHETGHGPERQGNGHGFVVPESKEEGLRFIPLQGKEKHQVVIVVVPGMHRKAVAGFFCHHHYDAAGKRATAGQMVYPGCHPRCRRLYYSADEDLQGIQPVKL